MTHPTVSIITVNFNNNEGLIKTLKSIKQQSFSSYEHIIIDAKSTDGSKETIEQYAKSTPHLTYWVSEPDKGIYDGMNKGIEHSCGDYLYFLNSGDCLMDDVLKKIPFDGTGYLYGDYIIISPKKSRHKISSDHLNLMFFTNDALPHQATFIHQTLFKHHQYDLNYKIVSDWIHSLQSIVFEKCSYKHLEITIAKCDGGGISANGAKVKEERLKWFKENLPKPFDEAAINLMEFQKSAFRDVIPILNQTEQFQKRAKKVVMFLYKMHSLFTKHK